MFRGEHGQRVGELVLSAFSGEEGCEVARLHLRHIRPLPNSLAATIGRFEQVLVPEMNMGQLSRILAAEIPANYLPMNKVTGRPFTNREIREKVQEVLR